MSIQANPRNFLFETVKMSAPERNGFDLSHELKQTAKAGYLYPFECMEALPNDDFEIQTESFIRLQAMLSPTMHRLKSYWHWFFVPNRLLWNYWEEFISRGNGKKLTDGEYVPPEPVTVSLYTMIYSMNSMYRYADSETTYEQIEKFTGQSFDKVSDYDSRLSLLQQTYPQIHFVKPTGMEGYDFLTYMYISTPRMANSIGIVDTAFQFGSIAWDSSNGFTWRVNAYNPSQDSLTTRLHSIKLSIMPFLSYLTIYNEYYRDENLIQDFQDTLDYFKDKQGECTEEDLPELRNLFTTHFRAWEKDYFTTATQLPQKAPDVVIPGSAELDGPISFYENGKVTLLPSGSTMQGVAFNPSDGGVAYNGQIGNANYLDRRSLNVKIQNNASATTVSDIRRSFALQRWFEKAMRAGTRYIETLKSFFNSDAGDARLQRPEFIGGTSAPVQISDVVQNSATADGSDTPQGNLAGYGVVADEGATLHYHAPEHGFVVGMFSILARTSYCQGIPKMFSRETWLDYAFPEFEHIGEQGVKNKELAAAPLSSDVWRGALNFAPWSTSTANQNFGYQSRYSEYKQIPDRFGGAFCRSLSFWSLGRMFGTEPTLSADFVNAQTSDRNFAYSTRDYEGSRFENSNTFEVEDSDTDQYICDFWVDVKKVTSLSLYSEPI